MGGIGESWTGVGDRFDANATAADALVVTSDQAKVWKERLDSCGLLDRSRRVVSIPNDESLERPAAVVFPVKLSSAGSLPLELGDGCKLCKLPLPAAARPVNQRAGRQRSASSAENAEEYAVYGAPLPPPPQLLSGCPDTMAGPRARSPSQRRRRASYSLPCDSRGIRRTRHVPRRTRNSHWDAHGQSLSALDPRLSHILSRGVENHGCTRLPSKGGLRHWGRDAWRRQ